MLLHRVMRTLFFLAFVSLSAACTAEKAVAVEAPAPALDLSVEARTQAALDAAQSDFEQRITPRLAKGQTVRGLVRTAKQDPKFDLSPAGYSREASSAAKLELIGSKVVYSAVARADDRSAAVLEGNGQRFRIAWEVSAEVTGNGELRDVKVVSVGDAVAESTQVSAR